ncbi:MAG: DNA translocase FtsK 4TM domain-containing protein [Candidatus Kuenenia sp.]|nr:DNA translocase FtsK 4TM domain-containing protein [Candidatus Kuenenia sp.]
MLSICLRRVIAISFLASKLFILLSFISYSHNDPPFADYPPNIPIANICGIAGAQISGYAMETLGKASYVIVIILGWFSLQFFFGGTIKYFCVKLLGAFLLIFTLSPLLTLAVCTFKQSLLSMNLGGIFGLVITSRLCTYFNITGTTIILVSGMLISIMLLANRTPFSLFIRSPKTKPEPEEGRKAPLKKEKNNTSAMISPPKKMENKLLNVGEISKRKESEIGYEPQIKKDINESLGERKYKESGETDISPSLTKANGENSYKLPSVELLEKPSARHHKDDLDHITQGAHVLRDTLAQFNVNSEIVDLQTGPVVTMYEIELAPGTKVGKVMALSDDLAIALKALSVRIVAPLEGRSSIGIEVPNAHRRKVTFRELLEVADESKKKMAIPLLIGKDVAGRPLISDLASMPHLLIAGTTGSGKSICLNSIILSILYTRFPSEVQLLLVDPKMVEFSLFAEIPHLISPVVTDMKKAAAVLEWAVNKMEERYALLASVGVKNISGYNKLSVSEIKKRLNAEEDVKLDDIPLHLPHIVIVVDELADLMMVASKEVESSVIRLSQKSRAVGIHLILATQRPSVDVITGLIKSNMPSRISFYVSSKVDSRTILDQNGAEKLLGSGDMLFSPPGTSKLVRVQGAYVSEEEVKDVVDYLRKHAEPKYNKELKKWKDMSDNDKNEPLFDAAVRIILETQRGSVSLLQRRLEIGYSRAARLIELMAEAGIVGEYKGSQAREVYLTLDEWDLQTSSADREENKDD